MGSLLDELNRKKGGGAPSDLGYLEGLGKSFVWSPLALLGVDAPEEVEQWRDQNPVGSIASQLVGYALPYTGYAKLATGIKPIAAAVKHFSDAEKIASAPFKTAFAREIVRFAPAEAARVAGAAAFGEPLAEKLDTSFRGTGDVALSAATDLALAGAFGGGFELFRAAGQRVRAKGAAAPGVDLNQPIQLQMRQLKENIDKGLVKDLDEAKATLARFQRQVRAQTPFGSVVGEFQNQGIAKDINRLFKEKETPGLLRTRLIRSVGGHFKDEKQLQDVISRAGLGDFFEAYVQYPRYIKAKESSARRIVGNAVRMNLDSLDGGNGWYYGRDKKDGLFVMAKRLSPDEWVLFKTDSPQRFVPNHAAFADIAQARAGIFGKDSPPIAPIGAEVFDAGVKYYQNVPVIDYRGLDIRQGMTSKLAGELLKKSGIERFAKQGSALFEQSADFAKSYLAPGMFQFTKHPMAARAFNLAKATLDAAEGMAERLFVGTKGLKTKSNLFTQIARGAQQLTDDNVQALIHEAAKDKDQWVAVWRTINTNSSIDDAIKEFGLAGAGLKLVKALKTIDEFQVDQLQKTLSAVGHGKIKPMPHHYMVSRTWKGDWRVPIYDGNKILGYAAHSNRGSAMRVAEAIVKEGEKDGLVLRIGRPALAGELEQDLRYLRNLTDERARLFGQLQDRVWKNQSAPKRLVEDRHGAIGYIGEIRPWTRDEFERLVLKQLRDYQRFQSKLTTWHLLKDDLSKIQIETPDVYDQLVRRINAMYGGQGEVARATNQFVDKLLSPVLGKNSADKIISAANKTLFRFELGFLNAGYNIANMLTFVQTAYPQLAFLASAAPSRVAQYYTYWPVQGTKGAIRGLGVLDMMKLTKRSFQVMGKPDDMLWKHFGRAASEGVWDPRFLEEYVGQKAKSVTAFKEILSGDQPFSNWLYSVADAIPGFSEKFARGHSFALGHTFFREVMGVTDDEMLYQLTKQFVEKTQFLYSVGDRPRIITGPMGSAFGLFKNWIMHYISWMLEYTGEGVARGNWKPLLWMIGGTTAVGGVGALPFYAVADGMSKWMSDKSLMLNIYSAFGGTQREYNPYENISDAVFYGLPAFFNFSVQNQVSAPFADPGEDAARLFSFAYWDRMKHAGRAFGAAVDHWAATGELPVRSPDVRDNMMRAFAPKTLYRVSQAIEDETLKSLSTGYPITDMTPAERLIYGLGANPRWVESQYRVADELWKDQNKMREAVSALGEAWAHGIETGDNRILQRVIVRAIYQNVDVSSVIKSGNARLAKGREELINRQFKPSAVLAYREQGLVR